MANESETIVSGDGSSHCKAGQDAVHDIVAKASELFNQLKSTHAAVQRTAENEGKRVKIQDILNKTQKKFDELRTHYDRVNDTCSSLAYVQVRSLIPYKDDPDNVEQIQKHRRNPYLEPHPDVVEEAEMLRRKIAERDLQLSQIKNDLRDFVYEINTMLHISTSK